MHRLRFAPSPTGFLHVGGARTALFNWLFVKKYGGQFLLRVEDTDKARGTVESTRAIFEGLEWLGLKWDEDVVFQGANLERHRADVARLLDEGKAYRCFCTTAELDEQRKAAERNHEAFHYDRRCDRLPADEVARRVAANTPFVVRFRMPDGETAWDDLVHGTITFANKDIGEGDFIILRSDATPIYNLAVVSDDIAMAITLVMRGDDHISNTPKQILLYQALGAAIPRFAHLPMIHGMDGKKLSKRHGATAVGDYQHMGILPQAMLNFLALLGWSPGNDIEVMTVPQMIELFSTDGLSKNAAIFDMKKLEWMNGQHLGMMTTEALAPLVSRGLGRHEKRRWWLIGFGIFGAAMFYGDGMITPAITVLGAVEGIGVIAPALHPFIVPIAVTPSSNSDSRRVRWRPSRNATRAAVSIDTLKMPRPRLSVRRVMAMNSACASWTRSFWRCWSRGSSSITRRPSGSALTWNASAQPCSTPR